MIDSSNKHAPKPCSFCNQDAKYTPLKEMSYHGVGIYFCYTCNTEYLYYQSGDLASTSIYTEISGKMYRWTITSMNSCHLWQIKTPGIPGVKKNEGLFLIKNFSSNDALPNITPQNINEKIKTWLVFL